MTHDIKKYYALSELLVDYRNHRQLTQIDFAAMLDVYVTFQKLNVGHFRQMGFQVIWKKNVDEHPDHAATFLSGNFNRFISDAIEYF